MAGLIPQSFIDDLLNRADIVDVVDARVKLRKTGKNYSGLCPFHQEKSPSFTVEPDKQFYYCFGCGAGGNVLGFLMNYESLEFPQAVESLASYMGVEVPYEENARHQQQREKKQTLYDVLDEAASYYQDQLRQHPQKERAVTYLKQRGLSGAIARDFGLGYAPPAWDNLLQTLGSSEEKKHLLLESGMLIDNPEGKRLQLYDRFRDRIMYPIRDSRGRVIGFGGRVLGDDKPKYLNSPETPVFRKGEELYGLFEAKKKLRNPERFMIVEGYMDVIALAQNNIWYAVATLGTATSSSHLQRLFKLAPEVVFCFDGDNAGRQAAWRALEQALPLMRDGLSARFLFLPEGEDPDTQVRKIGKDTFEQNIRESTRLAEFFFEHLGEQVDIQSLEGRARLGSLAMPYIHKLPQGIFRQLLLDQLASLTGADVQTLLSMKVPHSSRPGTPAQHSPATPGQDGQGTPTPGDSPPPNFDESFPPAQPPGRIAARPPARKKTGLSACMRAVNLILLQPDVVRNVDFTGLEEVNSPDIELLREVIALGLKYPQSTTPQLLGRIYATPLGTHLLRLADREQITPADGVEKEFSDIISHLLQNHQRRTLLASMVEQARQRLDARKEKTASTGENK